MSQIISHSLDAGPPSAMRASAWGSCRATPGGIWGEQVVELAGLVIEDF